MYINGGTGSKQSQTVGKMFYPDKHFFLGDEKINLEIAVNNIS